MRLTISKAFEEIVALMTYCATANMEYLSSTECANRFGNILETITEYKHIEEELGIDLITFHKALKNGIYYKVTLKESSNYGKIFFDDLILWGWEQDRDGNYYAMMQSQCQTFLLKDYGITWALSREELEK